jgi:hypothetical protein
MTRAAASRADSPARSRALPRGYLQRAELPLASLLALLPLIILYEIGTRQFAFDATHHVEQRIIAFTLMQRFFELFGATGRYLPALAVVCILLSLHIARNDPWKMNPGTAVAMWIEGTAWGVPLLAIGTLSARYVSHYLPLIATDRSSAGLIVLSIGAGIYEELVFRLIGLTLLHLLLVDLLQVPRFFAYLSMVVISAVGFALYHYLGYEAFTWRSFVFRTFAGVYFALLMLSRGFGITALSHSSYDIIVVLLRYSAGV